MTYGSCMWLCMLFYGGKWWCLRGKIIHILWQLHCYLNGEHDDFPGKHQINGNTMINPCGRSHGESPSTTLGPLGFGEIYQEDVNPDMSCGTRRLLIFIKLFLFSMRISWFMAMVQPSGHLNWKIWYGTDNCDQESHSYTFHAHIVLFVVVRVWKKLVNRICRVPSRSTIMNEIGDFNTNHRVSNKIWDWQIKPSNADGFLQLDTHIHCMQQSSKVVGLFKYFRPKPFACVKM